MLGSLDKYYGDNPIYVHLYRNTEEVVQSYTKRYSPNVHTGIMYALGHGILQLPAISNSKEIAEVANMHVEVVTRNIESFFS